MLLATITAVAVQHGPPPTTLNITIMPSLTQVPTFTLLTLLTHTHTLTLLTHTLSHTHSHSSLTHFHTHTHSLALIGFVGLVNQAMTCYLNSLLQTLYMTPEFRNALHR